MGAEIKNPSKEASDSNGSKARLTQSVADRSLAKEEHASEEKQPAKEERLNEKQQQQQQHQQPVKKEQSSQQTQPIKKEQRGLESNHPAAKPAARPKRTPKARPIDESLLTTKYAPRTLEEIIGNQSSIRNLYSWLLHWDSNHSNSTFSLSSNLIDVASASENRKSRESSRAALISGPPGIGKTTCVEVCCRLAGFELIQLNASDKRNMSFVRDSLKDSTSIK